MSDESILSFSEDISSAEAPPPLPTGDYPASIIAIEAKLSANSGNRYVDASMRIQPEDFPVDYPAENNPEGVTLHYRRVVIEDSPRARYNMRKFCEACGVAASKQVDLNDFLGADVVVTLGHSEYQGVTREEITAVQAR